MILGAVEIDAALRRSFDVVKVDPASLYWCNETADMPPAWLFDYAFNRGSNALRKRFTNAALERLSRGPVLQVFKGPTSRADLLATVSARVLRK